MKQARLILTKTEAERLLVCLSMAPKDAALSRIMTKLGTEMARVGFGKLEGSK